MKEVIPLALFALLSQVSCQNGSKQAPAPELKDSAKLEEKQVNPPSEPSDTDQLDEPADMPDEVEEPQEPYEEEEPSDVEEDQDREYYD